jgi:outer membrane protein OmpA-like peptidoglycan-associated protein/ABC-type nitrate/sulfonate/bicarbonate transport system substrate-binding protein
MKNKFLVFAIMTMCLVLSVSVFAQYKTATPMSQRLSSSVTLKPVKSGTHALPVIAWGGDEATIYGEMSGIFKNEGVNVTLYREDVLIKQVERCLAGETPYIRGTLGMINAAADAFRAKGMELVVFYGLTWSTGGDAMVARSGKTLKNIKTVAIQLDGPHMDYAANMFANAGRLDQIQFKWVTDLLSGIGLNGPDQFVKDASIDAVFCITPDALRLSSGGQVGTGSEGSAKGATMSFTSKTNSRIIFDVYAVRKDYFDANKEEVFALASALMKSQEALADLIKAKSSRQSEFRQLMTKSADLLLDSPTATADAEGMLGDCSFIGFDGNVTFFTGKGTTRNFITLNSEIQSAFSKMNLLDEHVNVLQANWNYADLKQGLKYATIDVANAATITAATSTPKFDANKVAKTVESKIAAESDKWDEEGTLYTFEIYFASNQDVFDVASYSADFKEILRLAQTNSGAIVVVEGHSDHGLYKKAEKTGSSAQELAQIKQAAKNLSVQRANNAKKSFLAYCKQKGIAFDESQLTTVGRGIESPKYLVPKTEAQWKENFRVVFRLKQVEAENLEFDPNAYK